MACIAHEAPGACEEVTASRYLKADDTPVAALDRGGGSFKGRLWTYLDPLARQVVFGATPTHERAGPEAFLQGFTGFARGRQCRVRRRTAPARLCRVAGRRG